MKYNAYDYKVISPREYVKVCLKCGRKFNTKSRNKRLCDNCAFVINNEKNNLRVKKYQKSHKYDKTYIGTGRLNGKPAHPHKEVDYVISEMKYLRLIWTLFIVKKLYRWGFLFCVQYFFKFDVKKSNYF